MRTLFTSKQINMKNFNVLLFAILTILVFSACQKDDPISTREPRGMTINSIDVTNFPASKTNGSGWDLSTGPDIYLTLNQGTSASTSGVITGTSSNASNIRTTPFTLGNPKTLSVLNSNYALSAYDSDAFDADDFIAGVIFNPSNYQADLPQSISLNTGTFSAILYVTWNF